MWTMGTDFKYQYANSWFRQLDKLIHYVNMVICFLYYYYFIYISCCFHYFHFQEVESGDDKGTWLRIYDGFKTDDNKDAKNDYNDNDRDDENRDFILDVDNFCWGYL